MYKVLVEIHVLRHFYDNLRNATSSVPYIGLRKRNGKPIVVTKTSRAFCCCRSDLKLFSESIASYDYYVEETNEPNGATLKMIHSTIRVTLVSSLI